jgi:hypothetical protein
MFEKDKNSKRQAALMRQDADAVAAIKENLSVMGERVDDLAQRLTEDSEKLKEAGLQFDDLNNHLGRLVACPRCGIVSDVGKVPLSGGIIREEAKRCSFCDDKTFDGPILDRKEEAESQ